MIGIVIANWNGEKLIGQCLNSLKNQTLKDFTVYIIDNGSSDSSKDIIKSYYKDIQIKLTCLNYNSGFAKANNIGISQAINDECEYIITLNNDIEMKEDCLQVAFKEIDENKSEFDIYQLLMINYYDRSSCDAVGLKFNKKLYVEQLGYNQDINEILRNEHCIDGVCAGAAIYSSKALRKVALKQDEYFDSNFFAYYEDVDLALRFRNVGLKSKLLKNCVVYHMHSATGNKSNGFKEYYLTRNMLIYMKRNQSIESYKKNKYFYYKWITKKIIININNMSICKAIIKGFRDGMMESKKINCFKY